MQESKTALEWFEQAKQKGHDWAQAAINNILNYSLTKTKHASMSKALARSFVCRYVLVNYSGVWHLVTKGDDDRFEGYAFKSKNPANACACAYIHFKNIMPKIL
jgi:hypothetical protein